MSRFQKLSHVVWHCQYHLVWTPKYRYRILHGAVGEEVAQCIWAFSTRLHGDIVEMNVQVDHIHLVVKIPPRLSISQYVGTVKGRTAIRIFKPFPELKQKPRRRVEAKAQA